MRKRDNLFRKVYSSPYGYMNQFQLFDSTKNSKSFLQKLRIQETIPAHNGCVNSIFWSETGKYLLSGSDDLHLCLTEAYTYSVSKYVSTGHKSNIFSAKFLPGSDDKVISCSGDGVIIYSDLQNAETSLSNKFNCHFGTAYEIMTVPYEPKTFLSCGEDGSVRWFDLRMKTSCSKESCREDVLINCYCAVTGLAVNPVCPYQLAVGCADSSVRIYDRRMLGTSATGGFKPKSRLQALVANFTVPDFTSNHRITSLDYSKDGQEMLVSYSSDFIYLFDVRCSFDKDPKILGTSLKDTMEANKKNKFSTRPLMKRLRVRGDWSDTGPNARPESESRGDQQPRSLHASLMQRMSDVLTNMYNRRSLERSRVSSSSHSEESEMEEAAQSEQIQSTASSDNPSEFRESAMFRDGTVDAERAVETTQERESSPDIQVHRSSSPQSGVEDIDISMINVSSSVDISSAEMEGAEADDPNADAVNQSVQNIKQEMSKQSAEMDNDSVINMTSLNSPHNHCFSATASEVEGNDSPVSQNGDAIKPTQSPMTVCDNHQAVANCDASSTSVESPNDSVQPQVEAMSSGSLRDPIPDIYVAPLPPADEASLTGDRQSPSRGPGQMTFMMEMDTSWDADSDDEAHPELSPGLEIPESVVSAFKKETEMTEEEFEKEEAESMSRISHPEIINSYLGHRNARTMIKEANFWGDNHIMSGSDCGHIFIWDRHTTELVMLMEADHHVVNCLQPHPFDPILASSGIDYDIKIWAPLREEPFFDEDKAHELVQRNRVMLEETRDTITVPASFMIRMLASLNHVTSGSGWRRMARHLREGARRNR